MRNTLETGLQIFELTLRSAKSYDVAKEFQRFQILHWD